MPSTPATAATIMPGRKPSASGPTAQSGARLPGAGEDQVDPAVHRVQARAAQAQHLHGVPGAGGVLVVEGLDRPPRRAVDRDRRRALLEEDDRLLAVAPALPGHVDDGGLD